MLNPIPEYRPSRHLRAVTASPAAPRARTPRWWDLLEWVLLPVLSAAIVCTATGRVENALWLLAGALVSLTLVRPLVVRRVFRAR